MIYKKFGELQLSALGMGTMRLPVKNNRNSEIDLEQTQKMVDYAIKNGVNYFDTAWGYHDGNSETAIGKALAAYPRTSYYLADKFPGYDLDNIDKVENIFEQQLKKTGVEYFDFYLFHNVCEMNVNQYLDPKYGILDYLLKQKQSGRIKHLGFSVHGAMPVLKKFLAAYGKYMEFCQLQINWFDWSFQSACEKVKLVSSYGIPVWVMEPLRGGKLCSLDSDYAARIKNLRPDENPTSIAFRFIQSIPEVTVTLSGMSDFEQMKQNIKTFSVDAPLNQTEKQTLFDIAMEMAKSKTLPCTSCRYCTSHCPQQLDIPWIISLYNEHNFTGGGFIARMALSSVENDKKPSACIGCKSCEAVCPQQLKISEMMSDFSSKL